MSSGMLGEGAGEKPSLCLATNALVEKCLVLTAGNITRLGYLASVARKTEGEAGILRVGTIALSTSL